MSTKATQTKKEFTLKQVFAMWRRKSKNGKTYFFTGKDVDGREIRGFYNKDKQNPKEPDIRIYHLTESGEIEKEVYVSLWCNASDNGKKYLSGKIDGLRVVGFINEKATPENKQPYLSVYWSDDGEEKKPAASNTKKSTRQAKQKEEPEFEDSEDNDLPF